MPALPISPSSMTMEHLVEALRRNNITLPRGRPKKQTYVELYQRHLLGGNSASPGTTYRNISINTSPKLGFSSDEDDEDVAVKIHVKRSKVNVNNNSSSTKKTLAIRKANKVLFEDHLSEVEDLSDADLKKELVNRGVMPGPIVATTRAIYERKLADLLLKPQDGEEADEAATEEEQEDEYSDSDVEAGTPDMVILEDQEAGTLSRSSTRSTSSYKSQVTRLIDRESSSVKQRLSVTPKRQEESPAAEKVTTETVTTATTSSSSQKKTEERGKHLVPVWLQLLIFVLFAAFLVLIWYNMETTQSGKDNHLT